MMPRFKSFHRRLRPLLAFLLLNLILNILFCRNNAFLLPTSSFLVHNNNNQKRCKRTNQQSTAFLSLKPTLTIDNDIQATINEQQIIRQHYNLTILIPAYNEIDRIGETLCTYINYMKHQPVYQHCATASSSLEEHSTIRTTATTTGQCSILVIDDGSTDGMCKYIKEKTWLEVPETQNWTATDDSRENYCWSVNENVSCISLPSNQGKGAAISRGMVELQCGTTENDGIDVVSSHHTTTCQTRSIVLVADADGSGDISCLNDMLHSLECLLESSSTTITTSTSTLTSTNAVPENDLALIVGKRQYPQSKSPLRSILSWGFRTCVSALFIGATTTTTSSSNENNNINKPYNTLGVSDTQCGFKLMTVKTGKLLYHQLNLKRWSHDVEVLYRASCLCSNVRVGECDVNWVDKDGSKLVSSGKDAVVMSAMMLSEIGKMRLLYALGKWTMSSSSERE